VEALGISRSDARLEAMERRLANIETALGAPAPSSLQERAALLEGPGAPPETTRLRQR
jgi:hypothetical protein